MRLLKQMLLIAFLSFSLNILAQENGQNHGIELDPIDTANRHILGFNAGFGIIIPSINPQPSQTFSSLHTIPTANYQIGLSLFFPSNKFAIETGSILQICILRFDYTRQNINYKDTINYSTLLFPIMISTYHSVAKRKIYFAGGIIASLDISKKVDKDIREFPLKLLTPALAFRTGFRLKGLTSIFDISLFIHYYPFNLLKNNQMPANLALNNFTLLNSGIKFIIR